MPLHRAHAVGHRDTHACALVHDEPPLPPLRSPHELILWDVDTLTFFGCYDGLLAMLKVATKSWRPNKRHEYQTYLAAIVLSIECLGCDFAGWGTRYPEAKRKADEILDNYFFKNRVRLLDVYMPLRGQLDQDKVRETLGPR